LAEPIGPETVMAPDRKFESGELVEILRHDHYTPEELAALLGISVHTIEQAAHSGELRATIVDHHVLGIRREAVVEWIEGLG
jgi:excisionase family DNA binding protein